MRDQSTELLPLKATLEVLSVELLEPKEVKITLGQRRYFSREEVNHLETLGIIREFPCAHVYIGVAPHNVGHCQN